MTSITELNDEYGVDHAIAGHAAGANGESILVISFPTTSDLASNLKERLAITAAVLPFVLAASFAPFDGSTSEAIDESADQATAEAVAETTDGATDGAEAEGAATSEDDEDAPKPSVGYAVLVDGEVHATFLLCLTLATNLPVENLDDDPADHTPLIFGLTDEEIATPSEALITALKLVNESQEIVFLVPQAPKAAAEGEAEVEAETAPVSDQAEAGAEGGESEAAEGAGQEAESSNEGEGAAKTFLGKLGDTVYVDLTFDHNEVTYRLCAVSFE